MSKPVASPFGFCFGQPSAGKKLPVLAVPEVEALALEYRTCTRKQVSMDFLGRMVHTAKILLGPNPISHLSSLYERRALVSESDYNYDFLQDTVKFIETGHRTMGISTISQLMDFLGEDEKFEFHPLKYLPPINPTRMERTSQPCESVYTRWLQQPNGVNDMLCTLIVLFGKHNQLCCNK
tara:strand:+ start:134534 stop:135073 length:540 start_codon:yes stop_codon:yes gene_type:complete